MSLPHPTFSDEVGLGAGTGESKTAWTHKGDKICRGPAKPMGGRTRYADRWDRGQFEESHFHPVTRCLIAIEVEVESSPSFLIHL